MIEPEELENWEDYTEQEWSDDLPSLVRSKTNRTDIRELGQRVNLLADNLRHCQESCIRFEEQIITLNRRLERLEHITTHGTNAISTRVALLEQTDQTMYVLRDEDRRELQSLQSLSALINSFPLGLKGLIATIIVLVILTTTIVDLLVKVNGIPDIIQRHLIED